MSVRAILLLGLFLIAASLLHGGIYSAGYDFVLNRFTGEFRFVPSEDESLETVLPTALVCEERARLTANRPGVRVARSGGRRGLGEARVGR